MFGDDGIGGKEYVEGKRAALWAVACNNGLVMSTFVVYTKDEAYKY